MRTRRARLNGALALVASTVIAAHTAGAAELRIGARMEPVMDPALVWSASNLQFYRHYLGFLSDIDPLDQARPGLAESFEPDGDKAWNIRLRPNLTFADGRPFTAADVIASIHRARTLPNAIGSYAGLFTGVTSMVAVDPRTIRIESSTPYPTLPSTFTQLAIVPREVAESAVSDDFATARANVSSGPYRFVEYTRGTSLVLERNPRYAGTPARWDRVTFRFLPNGSSRVAALLTGEVDAIDGVPPADVEHLRRDQRVEVFAGSSDRLVFLGIDSARDVSPTVTDAAGAPLPRNPLQDVRVRKALSLAIDREAIRDRVMNGLAYPTNQLVARGFGGYSEAVPPAIQDRDEARRLLTEAGQPNGFGLALQCPSDRYVNSSQLCQAVAQMWTRIGIRTTVQSEPYSVYLRRLRSDGRAATYLASWSAASTGEADVLRNVMHTYDAEAGLGTWNSARYSNPAADRLIRRSMEVVDQAQRRALQAEAMTILMTDYAAIPIHAQAVVVAARRGLGFTVYADESTLADSFVPK